MNIKDWKKEDWKRKVFTIPNILSLFRLVLIPIYVTIYLNATQRSDYILAGAILAVSCLTDLIDGKIARRFNMISTLGKILDPIADKATQFALTLCLAVKYPVLWIVLALFTVKELFQAVAGIVHLRKGKMLPGALMAGKVCTAVFFVSLIILVLIPNINVIYVNILAIVDFVLLTWSFITYILAYFGRNTKVEDIEL